MAKKPSATGVAMKSVQRPAAGGGLGGQTTPKQDIKPAKKLDLNTSHEEKKKSELSDQD